MSTVKSLNWHPSWCTLRLMQQRRKMRHTCSSSGCGTRAASWTGLWRRANAEGTCSRLRSCASSSAAHRSSCARSTRSAGPHSLHFSDIDAKDCNWKDLSQHDLLFGIPSAHWRPSDAFSPLKRQPANQSFPIIFCIFTLLRNTWCDILHINAFEELTVSVSIKCATLASHWAQIFWSISFCKNYMYIPMLFFESKCANKVFVHTERGHHTSFLLLFDVFCSRPLHQIFFSRSILVRSSGDCGRYRWVCQAACSKLCRTCPLHSLRLCGRQFDCCVSQVQKEA